MSPEVCIGRITPPKLSSLQEQKTTLFSAKKFPVPAIRETPSNALNLHGDAHWKRRYMPENYRNSLFFSLFAGKFAETG